MSAPPTTNEQNDISKGKRLALVIGVNEVPRTPLASLLWATNDAQEMAQALQKHCSFDLLEPPLVGEKATSAGIKRAVLNLITDRNEDDFILFYFSGNALSMMVEADRADVYLGTYDFDEKTVEIDETFHLSLSWLRDTLYIRSNAGQVLIILDSCYSGQIGRSGPDLYLRELQQRLGYYFGNPGDTSSKGGQRLALSSTGSSNLSLEKDGHGLMTYWLLPALRGEVPEVLSRTGELSLQRLFAYLADQMPPEQQPTLSGDTAGKACILAVFSTNPQGMNTQVIDTNSQKDRTATQEVLKVDNTQTSTEPPSQTTQEVLKVDNTQTSTELPSQTSRETNNVPTHMDQAALEDKLDRESFAKVLAMHIRKIRNSEEYNRGSFTINIHGEWGSGKTSLLNFLQDELQTQTGESPPWIVVEFNAWKHQRLGSPWWWLMTSVVHQGSQQLWTLGIHGKITRSRYATGRSRERARENPTGQVIRARVLNCWRSIYLRCQEYIWRFRSTGWLPYILAFVALALILLILRLNSFFGLLDVSTGNGVTGSSKPPVQQIADTAQAISAIIALILTTWGIIFGLSRSLILGSVKFANAFMDSSRDPMRAITNHFSRVVSRIKQPVAIFIDDLDRCQESYVVELLEGIQTLFSQVSVVYLVAADRRWICASYDQTYTKFTGTLEETGRPLGYHFLEKAFQLSTAVPPMSPITQSEYWKYLLRIDQPKREEKLEEATTNAEQKLQQLRTEKQILEELERLSNSRDRDPINVQAFRNAAVKRLASPEVEAHTEHALQAFASLLEANPRAMKRFLNSYSLQRATATLVGSNVHMQQLALWTIILLRWPLLAEYLENNPEMVKYIGEKPQDTPKHLQELFQDRTVCKVFKDNDIGSNLDEAAIRTCACLSKTVMPKDVIVK